MNSKKTLVWTTIVLVVIILNLPLPASLRMKDGVRDGLAPFQNVMTLVLSKGKRMFSVVTDANKAISDKEEMLKEIALLREKVRRNESLAEENAGLRANLRFKKRSPHRLIPCEVIGRGDISSWWQTVRLNKGSVHGVKEDLAVITVDGLVGKTTQVSRHTSDVLLITDPNCKVAARFPSGGGFGIVRGQGVTSAEDPSIQMLYSLNPCRMDYIAKTEVILRADSVITSGLGGTYPAGLKVGVVKSVEEHSSGLYKCVAVMPAAELMDLKYVFVVVKEQAGQ